MVLSIICEIFSDINVTCRQTAISAKIFYSVSGYLQVSSSIRARLYYSVHDFLQILRDNFLTSNRLLKYIDYSYSRYIFLCEISR